MSEDLVRLGIASSNLVPNQPSLDSGPLFMQAIAYARNRGIATVLADRGSYYFQSIPDSFQHVAIAQANNLTIDFEGSDLYLAHTLYTGLSFYNCTGLILQNFTIDYQPLPFTQVQVVSIDTSSKIQYVVPAGWRDPSFFNALQNAGGWDGTIEVHMFRSGRRAPGTIRMAAKPPFSANQFTLAAYGEFVPSAAAVSSIRPGDIAVLAARNASSPVNVVGCSGCLLRNIVAYSSAGQGVSVAYSQQTVIERVHTIPRPGTDRLVSTFGQGFTPSGPNNAVRLSRAIRTLDDGFSFDLWIAGIVQSQVAARSLIVQGTFATTLSQGRTLPNGAAVAFQRPSDGAILGSAQIVSQTAISASQEVTFSFDRDLPSNLAGAAMYATDPNLRGANTALERNAVEEQTDCCTGMSVWGFANSTLTGNYIQRTGMTGVLVTHTLSPLTWQVPPTVNFGISNNIIDQPNSVIAGYDQLQLGGIDILATESDFVPMSSSPHRDVSVTNNFIADPGVPAIWLGNATGGSVSGNYFLNPNGNAALQAALAAGGLLVPAGTASLITQPLVVETSQGIAIGSNTIDQTSGRMWVTDIQYNELAGYAPGSTIRLSAYNLGALSNPSVTVTDADGNTVPMTVQKTSPHAVDVQLPSTTSLGGAYLTLSAGSAKYFGTFFTDSQDNIPALNGCTYEVSPSSLSVPANGGTVPILVVTQAGCTYQVRAADPFVSAGPAATGTGVISVVVNANTMGARTANIEIAGQLIMLTQAALLPTIQAIVDSWDYTPGIAPGAWVTITGTALTTGAPQTWNLNGTQQLPTTLGGVAVTFNGTPAALYYVSPTQINALVPALTPPGAVQVVVQANGLISSPFSFTATATLPAIYALPTSDGSEFFVTAALAGTGTLIGNGAVDSRVTRAALPGDTLDLYMIGLGSTLDPSDFITNQVFAGAYPVSATVIATVGGEPAQVLFAGLTSPGLYLVRVVIPSDLPAGPQPIQVTAGGSRTRSSLMLIVGTF
jgi:uncharacterized protein (TIGR03437 family)